MLSKIIEEKYVREAKDAISKAEKIVIISHMGPDGDAVGSTLAMHHFLKTQGKTSTVILPNDFPHFFSWMPAANEIVVALHNQEQVVKLLKEAELIIMIDFNELGRVNGLRPLIEVSKAKKILIDHHLYPMEIADIIISHPQISSASELVFRLICRMGFSQEINLACAECIYVGMMTDTGCFSYNSNQNEIYLIVSFLLQKGIDKDEIYKKVYYTYSESRMRLVGYCLSEKMKIYPEYKTALIWLSKEEMDKFECKTGDTEGIVNMPFSINGIVFCAFIRDDRELKKVKISFRSIGKFPANKVASDFFNGGGHLNAAGGESTQTLEETIGLFEKILPEYKSFL